MARQQTYDEPRNLSYRDCFSLPTGIRVVQAPDAHGQMTDWYDFGRGKERVRIKSREESVAELEHCL